jgi:hypothetical protein
MKRADGSRLSGGYRAGSSASTSAYATQVTSLPPTVDLRPFLTPVEDQRTTSSCVANAVAGAYEYLVKQHLGSDGYDVSRLFVYYNARKRMGAVNEDGGSQICDAVESLRAEGACSEGTWPFDVARVNAEPSPPAYDEASKFLVQDVASVPTDLAAWKGALADGYPIVFALRLFASFDRQRKPGSVPMPSPAEANREDHSGHAMLCVGYSDKDKVFIVRNSWGTTWGDRGYCYIPYSYLMNAEYNYGDSWVVKRLDAVPVEGHTSQVDEGVLPDADHLLDGLDDAQYTAFLDALGEIAFETRLAQLLLGAAALDGTVEDAELEQLTPYVDKLLTAAGDRFEAADVLEYAIEELERVPTAIDDTIRIFGEHLPPETLAAISNEVLAVLEAGGVDDDEADFHDRLVTAWQLA